LEVNTQPGFKCTQRFWRLAEMSPHRLLTCFIHLENLVVFL
jgi:hypothetical protein